MHSVQYFLVYKGVIICEHKILMSLLSNVYMGPREIQNTEYNRHNSDLGGWGFPGCSELKVVGWVLG